MSVIRQKGDLKTEVTRKQSTPNFPKKEHFLPPDTRAYEGVRNVCFSENLTCFVSFYLRFEVRPFTLLPMIRTCKTRFQNY